MSTQFKKHPLALAVTTALVAGSVALTGCSDSDNGGATAPVTGTYTISTSGGTGGDSGSGGYAGDVDVYLYGGTGGVQVLKSGVADASYTSQMNSITPHLGVTPLTISANTTVPAIAAATVANAGAVTAGAYYMGTDGNAYLDDGDAAAEYATEALANGTPYLTTAGDALYLADGGNAAIDKRVTGIQVNAGTTLTLGLNVNTSSAAEVRLSNDLVNRGTITSANISSTQRGHLTLNASSYLGSGTLTTAGSTVGQHGGNISLWADYSLITSGAMTSSGADNSAGNGGNGGYIDINSGYYFENSGLLTSKGGNATGGVGGNAGYVDLWAQYGSANNSGNVVASGGSGDSGGNGDWISLGNGNTTKAVRNSGNLDSSGGSGSAGNGGSADNIRLYAYGGPLVSSGSLTAAGGNASNNNNAGNGGNVNLDTYNGYASWGNGTTPQGSITLSGNINLAGGSAAGAGTGSGGSGGALNIATANDGQGNESTAFDQKIALLGYQSITAAGGDGGSAGNGATVGLMANYGWDDTTYTYALTGPVINEVNITTSGGNMTAGATADSDGARAGDINLETSYYYAYHNPNTRVVNRGTLTLNGGGSKNESTAHVPWSMPLGNHAGDVWVWGYYGVENSGAIVANGGNDAATDGGTLGVGGVAGQVMLYAEMAAVTSSASITANGGNGEYRGGSAHWWTAFYGPSVKVSGAISGKGGDASAALANSMGGYGGWVWAMGNDGPAAVSFGGATMTPGSGNLTDGSYWAGNWIEGPGAAGYIKVVGAHCEGDC